ncbi:amidohydrolase (plasmid) [Mesorhizobium sp. AR07]|uniref:amidohydrolase family protein n=1 Tax=Mesorhizobium sp. AR07 TaxID=2865838 RepID=UPI0021608FC3|nr:amidohydrolase family protein [Mesorhizobium sp. AR07]UVK48342.1 amidohydrolase [Mesorhizobium sp. AR07]
MNDTIASPKQPVRSTSSVGIADCDIHPALKDRYGLHPYLSKRWRDHLDQYGELGFEAFASGYNYDGSNPMSCRRDAWPDGGLPGSDLALMRKQHLDPNNVVFGVLQPMVGLPNGGRNLDLSNALSTAINDWQITEFVEPEDRLRASVVVVPDDVVASVAEIEKRALDARFVQVEIFAGTTEPLGHRRYRPILEAAGHHGFPIGMHIGGRAGARTASGWPSYYCEDHLDLTFAAQSQIMSLILDGVFDQLPSLKVVIVECGCTWSIGLGHRLDMLWRRMGSEVASLKHPPSQYLRKHFYFSTQPVEEPDNPEELNYLFDQIGWDKLLYASDYPHWDFDDPRYAFKARISEEHKALLFRENARNVYRGL